MLKIEYSLEMDLKNYDWSYINRKFPIYNRGDFDTAPDLWPAIKNKISKAKLEDKLGIVRDYLLATYKDNDVMKDSISVLRKCWSKIESIYLDRLCQYMVLKSQPEKITVYITTLSICPYNINYNYFYISFFSCLAVQIKCIMHELMHLYFLSNYRDYLVEKGVSDQGILEINEALTELLNLEFKDLLSVPEINNKPSVKDLQNEVISAHRENEDFKQILDRLINLRSIN